MALEKADAFELPVGVFDGGTDVVGVGIVGYPVDIFFEGDLLKPLQSFLLVQELVSEEVCLFRRFGLLGQGRGRTQFVEGFVASYS